MPQVCRVQTTHIPGRMKQVDVHATLYDNIQTQMLSKYVQLNCRGAVGENNIKIRYNRNCL